MDISTLRGKGLMLKTGGEEYLLRYDLNSFAYLEKKLGSDFMNIDLAADKMSLSTLKHFLRAGLLVNFDNDNYLDMDDYNSLRPKLSEVGKMFGMEDIRGVVKQIEQALIAAMPEPSEGEGENSPGEK